MTVKANSDQVLLYVEQVTKEKLRKHFTRNYGGFHGISRRTPHELVHFYCYFSTPELVAVAGRKDVHAMRAHKLLCELSHADLIIAHGHRWRASDAACQQWAQEVIDGLHRCGLPFNDDAEAMEQCRLKAKDDRERRRALMTTVTRS